MYHARSHKLFESSFAMTLRILHKIYQEHLRVRKLMSQPKLSVYSVNLFRMASLSHNR
jgi:hypothetical protein